MKTDVSAEAIDKLYVKLKKEAEDNGYYLNPTVDFTKDLVRSLLINEQRYGYWACPCRLSEGDKQEDLDIICPCDYRDMDVDEFDCCFCGLYVSKDIAEGKKQPQSIPERRPVDPKKRPQFEQPTKQGTGPMKLSKPIWRCRVCGYLAARDEPPGICPVCKAKKDRFERFI